MKRKKIQLKNALVPFALMLIVNTCLIGNALAQQSKNANTFTVENYYKTKWGFADEFIHLWKTNHFPLLKKAIDNGDIISVIAEKPKLHSGEDTRWDFKVTIIFKDIDKAFDANLTEPYKKIIFPNLEKLKSDEQHRFELLISHWDVLSERIALD